MVDNNDDYIRVAVRVRPNLYEQNDDFIVKVIDDYHLNLDKKHFTFDKVFGSDSVQVFFEFTFLIQILGRDL